MTTDSMYLFEVVRWGNDSDNIYNGGANGPDTCFLVRAENMSQAAGIVDAELATWPQKRVQNWAGAVHLLGTDLGTERTTRILRGPYTEHAFCYGWKQWHRNYQDSPWEEWVTKS